MAQLVAARTTDQAITETRLVRQVAEEIADLEPNTNPLLTFMMKLNRRKVVNSPRIEWFEQDYIARWTTANSTVSANSSSTTVTVTDGTLFVAGDLFTVPQSVSTSTPPEIIRVTAVSGNVLTVVRGVGSSTLVSWVPGAAIRILGTAFEEKSTKPTIKVAAPVAKIGYTEIFRTSTGDISGTAEASEHYGNSGRSERLRERKKKMVEHKEKMNASFLWGVKSEALTGGPNSRPIRTSMGLNSVVTTNVYDMGGVMTQKSLETFARMAFRYNQGRPLLLLCSALIKSGINEWAKSFGTISQGATEFGVNVQVVTTGHGKWMLTNDWMLEDGVSGGNGFSGWAFSIDVESLMYRFLKGRDTFLEEGVQTPGDDGFEDVLTTEAGLQIEVEKRFAKMYNVTDYSA